MTACRSGWRRPLGPAAPGAVDFGRGPDKLSLMERRLAPEILDGLPATDPRAQRSRRDLRIINRLLGSGRWICNHLSLPRGNHLSLPRPHSERRCNHLSLTEGSGRVVEPGAGDGQLGKELLRVEPGLRYCGVDWVDRPADLPEALGWRCGDLRDPGHYAEAVLVVGRLVLHHLSAEELRELGVSWTQAGVRRILLVEPRRARLHEYQLAAGRVLGFHEVTLHDGAVSIRAGFRGEELPQLLGLDRGSGCWRWRVEESWWGAYRMEAWRCDG